MKEDIEGGKKQFAAWENRRFNGAASTHGFGLSWALLPLSVCVSRAMTCENTDLKDSLLHLGFESSRSHIGFKTAVSVAFILPDNLTFCVV